MLTEAKMKLKLVVNCIFISLAVILPRNASAAYFHQCEFIECYLFPEASLNESENQLKASTGGNTVMDVMQRHGLNQMARLLKATGFAENNLTSSGPWTVFAMTDAGFDDLQLKTPKWHKMLTTNMTIAPLMMANHIVKGLIPESTIRPGVSSETLGDPVYFHSIENGKGIAVNRISRIIGQLKASNGIVYIVTNQIIEDVFTMLPYMPSVVGEEVSIMIKALEISGVSKMLENPTSGPFTMFIPINKAFEALPSGKLDELMSNPAEMRQLVLNHMLPEALFFNEHEKKPVSGLLQTAGGASIRFRKNSDGQMTLGKNGANIMAPNRAANNGINNIIDKVIEV